MLASHLVAPGKIELIEIPEPVLSPVTRAEAGHGEIIFQPETTCLCGSDLPYFTGSDEWEIEIGHSLHEMIGTVTATNGRRWKAGDRVLAVPVMQQGLQERFILDEARTIPIATNIPEEHALMAQPLGTALFALKKLPNLLDKTIAVVGQGPMGQLMNAALSNLGAREIIGIDLLESRLQISPSMGATATICNQHTDPISAVREILKGELPDIVIEAVGHADQQLNLCIELCRQAGSILVFGVPPETIDQVRLRDLVFKNITIYSSMNPDFNRDFPLAMQWLAENRIDVTPIITHRFPLADIQQAFELFRDRRDGVIKVIVEFPALKQSR
ncbi:zinc-dependent alcohol dehydrogenase [Gimesia algae]|uniref:L-threonine 3-dehydrogenase n=1 Tax=Gimesia algae TaxID=2527971 RepID=A0A517V991_9PLAN|nr:zinc-binding dehydrogenase [Gimesia algae]QDT89574.1 L-threonine 3-dehydrogenase [Gimesia algae]